MKWASKRVKWDCQPCTRSTCLPTTSIAACTKKLHTTILSAFEKALLYLPPCLSSLITCQLQKWGTPSLLRELYISYHPYILCIQSRYHHVHNRYRSGRSSTRDHKLHEQCSTSASNPLLQRQHPTYILP